MILSFYASHNLSRGFLAISIFYCASLYAYYFHVTAALHRVSSVILISSYTKALSRGAYSPPLLVLYYATKPTLHRQDRQGGLPQFKRLCSDLDSADILKRKIYGKIFRRCRHIPAPSFDFELKLS